jgi:hypothetical protein
MLNDPEPPPQPWWIRALGVASAVLVVASTVVAIVGVGDDAAGQRHVAARTRLPSLHPNCDTDKGRRLTALGATPGDWANTHTAAYAPVGYFYAARWNPDTRLPRFRGHEGAVYNKTRTYSECAVSSYYIQLVHESSPSAALHRARRELPADARLLWHRELSRCSLYQFVSDRLDSELRERAPRFDATSALVRLIESRPGDKNSITRVALSLNDAPPPVDAGRCKL